MRACRQGRYLPLRAPYPYPYLQPIPSSAFVCSLQCTWRVTHSLWWVRLQPLVHTVAASISTLTSPVT